MQTFTDPTLRSSLVKRPFSFFYLLSRTCWPGLALEHLLHSFYIRHLVHQILLLIKYHLNLARYYNHFTSSTNKDAIPHFRLAAPGGA